MTQRFGLDAEQQSQRTANAFARLSRPEVRVPYRASGQHVRKPRKPLSPGEFWSFYILCVFASLACAVKSFVTGDMRWWWGAVGFFVVAFVGTLAAVKSEIRER